MGLRPRLARLPLRRLGRRPGGPPRRARGDRCRAPVAAARILADAARAVGSRCRLRGEPPRVGDECERPACALRRATAQVAARRQGSRRAVVCGHSGRSRMTSRGSATQALTATSACEPDAVLPTDGQAGRISLRFSAVPCANAPSHRLSPGDSGHLWQSRCHTPPRVQWLYPVFPCSPALSYRLSRVVSFVWVPRLDSEK
mmetsp:Transcript_28900/g.74258  ORF Transcript_28900/g.74258 Transcript_28900/m.74258 type:complete len:201 (-) Transcript_28900:49-651(-)